MVSRVRPDKQTNNVATTQTFPPKVFRFSEVILNRLKYILPRFAQAQAKIFTTEQISKFSKVGLSR